MIETMNIPLNPFLRLLFSFLILLLACGMIVGGSFLIELVPVLGWVIFGWIVLVIGTIIGFLTACYITVRLEGVILGFLI